MKPVFAKVPEVVQNDVFAVRTADLPYFSTEFHFHKECQMNYIVQSEGRRIIGDRVETFKGGELVFLGSDLPHVWHNDKWYFEKNDGEIQARSVTLFFDSDKLIELLSHLIPVNKLQTFLKMARRGMKFSGKSKKALTQLLLEMTTQQELAQLVTLLKILELLSATTEYELLASSGYVNTYQAKDNDRMDRVFKYIFSNFTSGIKLDEIAALANMNKQAFCRYFKSRTQKTFTEFVNNIRVGHACKLMTEKECRIAELAYDCGFNSLSNFNRFFREMKGINPRDYKKMISP
ncbi:AraC-like DNA-binding protein [Anseongella ginsenosidimutans]|uniref:AraC-like DNA-binding protein n=1 Tax=Anseongella ginsenosidimutans TaxID=496056 RepID=A0A4R3KN98_9SPHI|nr:AraC family transcriptional regulator [Anseongella ginsenosidimutans]QEC52692.1 helix-turn-helix domain-containing protein [Anseongella ginsenosidimutans]TCS85440.1 AraC-like DNA-binding protein [Anseongella ginsenosidimutans]